MAMKGCSTFSKAPALLKHYRQIVLCLIQDTRCGGITLLQRCSQCILHPQPTGQNFCIGSRVWPGSDCNEGVLHILQSPSIIGSLSSDCFVSYPGHSLLRGYPSAEVQSLYSTSPADQEKNFCIGSRVWYKRLEEGRSIQQPKRYEYSYKMNAIVRIKKSDMVHKSLPNIPTGSIIELNEQI